MAYRLDTVVVGSGQPLVLAHGAGGRTRGDFAGLIKQLKPTRRLIGPDYPGSGRSDQVDQDLDLDELAESVVQAAQAAGANRFPMVGYSMGAAVAITAAVRYPEVITGLVLTNGFAAADRQLRSVALMYDSLMRAGDRSGVGRLLAGRVGAGKLWTTAEMAARDRRARQIAEALPAGAAQQMRLATALNVTGLLSQVAVPTLVVASLQDQIVGPEVQRELAADVAGAELLQYPESGHVLTPDQAVTWSDDVATFLERHHL